MRDRCWPYHIIEKEYDDVHLPHLVKLVVGPSRGSWCGVAGGLLRWLLST